MIMVSAGMQKAGSGWYFNMTNDLLVTTGHQDARAVRDRYRLHSISKFRNCNVGKPLWPKLALLFIPHLAGNTFAIKTHAGPTPSLVSLMSRNVVKATYIYRDPRDVALSAFNHGQKIRKKGHTHSFANLETIELAILAAREWLEIWEAWTGLDQVLVTRYEDLCADSMGEAQRLCNFLSLDVPAQDLERIVDIYQVDVAASQEDGQKKPSTHFHKGVVGRFRDAFDKEELALCNEQFAEYLPRMGYQV